jgi:hypothetical protein
VPKEYKFAARIGSKAVAMTTKALAAKFGDPLHRFLSNKAVQTARQGMDKLKVMSLVDKNEVSGREKELIAIQVFELDKIMIQLEDCRKTLQNRKPDKEYEVELRKWIKNNRQELKTIYAAMEVEMGHGRAGSLPVDSGQTETSPIPDPSSIVPEAVDSRQKAELLATQLVINLEIGISGDMGAPKATATIKARQEEMKSMNPEPNHGPSQQPINSEIGPQERDPGASPSSPHQKQIVPQPQQRSAYFGPSKNNLITNNALITEDAGVLPREGRLTYPGKTEKKRINRSLVRQNQDWRK